MTYRFYDTNALLDLQEKIFDDNPTDIVYISSISFMELENIKTSSFKDDDVKYQARQLLHLLMNYHTEYNVVTYTTDFDKILKKYHLPDTNDNKIIASAYAMINSKCRNPKAEFYFITSDVACAAIADTLGLHARKPKFDENKRYSGFIELKLSDEELASFYSEELQRKTNKYELLINQYLLLKDENGKIVDKYKWTGSEYKKIKFDKFKSKSFGAIAPIDDYQTIAIDALRNNKITMLRGAAGTGKSYLSFGYMFEQLETGAISKIIIFCNTVATRGSAKLGFYPGSRTEKLLDSQIGNLLISKIGSRDAVESMIANEELVLLPMSDIRGYDTTGMNAAIYISEAQNLDRELMKLALQRIGEDSFCILDGDFSHQVDSPLYAGSKNGMRRASEVFRGSDIYGEVELQKIHRSKIASIAELM